MLWISVRTYRANRFSENAIKGNIYLDALELFAFPQIEVTGSEKETPAVFH
jgi:hypothetical protein